METVASERSRKNQPDVSGLRHVIESQQFTLPLLTELFQRSRGMERVVARGGTLDYQNKILANLFYQASTRTRFSFEAAMYRLGGKVLSTEQASAFSSEVAGEQVEDSIRIIANYSDVIVVQASAGGGSTKGGASFTGAGDQRRRWRRRTASHASLARYVHHFRERPLTGLSVAVIGELDRGRTARSLAYLLAKFDRVKIFFVLPRNSR